MSQLERTQDVLNEIEHERIRQVTVEGWSNSHDDLHTDRSLATAAGVYALFAGMSDANRDAYLKEGARPPIQWPWADRWWKPKDRRSELIRAAALIVAEIERIDRALALESEMEKRKSR